MTHTIWTAVRNNASSCDSPVACAARKLAISFRCVSMKIGAPSLDQTVIARIGPNRESCELPIKESWSAFALEPAAERFDNVFAERGVIARDLCSFCRIDRSH